MGHSGFPTEHLGVSTANGITCPDNVLDLLEEYLSEPKSIMANIDTEENGR